MKIAVLGSGSRGNAIALTAAGRVLLVDAGFGIRSLQRRAAQAGVRLDALAGIVVTHEHRDHAAGVAALAARTGCPVYASRGTLRAMGSALDDIPTHVVASDARTAVGPFDVEACRVSHDAAEPVAVAVECGGHRVGIAHDVGRATSALRQLLTGAHCLIVESNHDDGMLRTGPYPPAIRARIAGPLGHLSNRGAAELLGTLCHRGLRHVVLAHLSRFCNAPRTALDTVRPALEARGFRGPLLVARQREPLAPFAVSEPEQLSLGVAG